MSKSSPGSKGLPHKEIIDYLLPDLDLNCLRLADPKVNEKLIELDEQYVSLFSFQKEKLVYIQQIIIIYLFRLLKIIKLEFYCARLDNLAKKRCIITVSLYLDLIFLYLDCKNRFFKLRILIFL